MTSRVDVLRHTIKLLIFLIFFSNDHIYNDHEIQNFSTVIFATVIVTMVIFATVIFTAVDQAVLQSSSIHEGGHFLTNKQLIETTSSPPHHRMIHDSYFSHCYANHQGSLKLLF